MNRRDTLLALLAIGAAPLAAEAQPAGKMKRVGFLYVGAPVRPDTPISASHRAFLQRLRELGYADGVNVVVEYHNAERPGTLPDVAAGLANSKVDVIVAVGSIAIEAARQATRTIPIVMASSLDALSAGYIASLARPGGNITGLTLMSTDVVAKRVELLREAFPSLKRLTAVYGVFGPPQGVQAAFNREVEIAGRRLGIEIRVDRVAGPDQFEALFADVAKERGAGVLVFELVEHIPFRIQIATSAIKHRVATMHGLPLQVEAGGLLSYGPNTPELFRNSADYVDKILRGANPASLPVAQPTKFELVVNLKTAKALGLTIPQTLLLRADRVIE